MIKATKEQLAFANKVITDHKVQKVFMNNQGEFFTVENLALNSVGGKRENLLTIEANKAVAEDGETSETPVRPLGRKSKVEKNPDGDPELRGEKPTTPPVSTEAGGKAISGETSTDPASK